MELTESVRSFQVPATPGTIAWPPSLPSVPTSRATRVTSAAKERSWSTIVLIASLSWRISPRTSTVILRDRSPFATAMVTAELALCADLARYAGHFRSEGAHLLDHRVDDGGRPQELALERPAVHLQCHGLGQITFGHRGDRPRDLGGRPQQIIDQRVDRG